jgi:hypothetical protein
MHSKKLSRKGILIVGHKYEVCIWTNKGYGRRDYHYQSYYTGNTLLGAIWAMWKNRKYGCVKLEVRR